MHVALGIQMKYTIQLPFNLKWTGPIDKSGPINSVLMGKIMIHILYPQVSLVKTAVCTLQTEVLSGECLVTVPLQLNLYVNAHRVNVSMHYLAFSF